MTNPRPELTAAILRFNLLPSHGMHPSWRSQYFPEPLGSYLFATERTARHLSRHILKILQLEHSGYFDPSWPHWSIVSASSDTLAAYAQACGCVLLRHLLQRTVQREQVMYYRQQLGTLYSFILEKGPLLCPTHPIVSEITPEQLLEKAQQLGWLTLRHAASLFPEAVQKRFMLKLPYQTMHLPVDETALSAQQALTLLTRLSYEMS